MTTEIPPQAAPPSFLRSLFLRFLLVIVAVTVAAAIIAALRGEPLGQVLAKLQTTVILSGIFVALGLACANAFNKRPVPTAFLGIAACALAIGLVFIGVWLEQSQQEWWWKAFLVVAVYALALWRCARLSLVELGAIGTLVMRATGAACLAIAGILALAIVREGMHEMVGRVLNALWIVAIGGHIAVFILERMKPRPAPPTQASPPTPPTPSA